MKILLLLAMTLFIFSCGKDNNDAPACRSHLQMQRQCFQDNAPIYGSAYASEMCTNAYTIQRCY